MDGSQARALLGVPENASIAQIRHGFRRAVLVAHPDHGGSATWFDQLLAARDLLMADAPADTATVAPSAFDRACRPPSRPSFRVADISLRARPASIAPRVRPDFDRVLADVLAATTAAPAA